MAHWTGTVYFSDGSTHTFPIDAEDVEKASEIARRYTAQMEIVENGHDDKHRRVYRTGMMVSFEVRPGDGK